MKKITLKLKKTIDTSYPIWIGNGILEEKLSECIEKMNPTSTALIMDDHLSHLFGDKISGMLSGRKTVTAVFKAGEANKNLATIQELFTTLAKNRLDRKSLVIALGGGVTGDMAGFLSSIYLRGIPFIQVPTSLLAMVDSSIGGKTGVDTPEGKNLIGAFYQPKAVIIDTDFIKTLPDTEFTNGMAEIIKHAAVLDSNYFAFLKNNAGKILNKEISVLNGMIVRSLEIKASIVQKDELEKNIRQTLNFGHTIGHAIEQASGFQIPHGYAVALGMILEAGIGHTRGIYPEKDYLELKGLLEIFGLLRFREIALKIPEDQILSFSRSDKKNAGNKVKAVLLQKNGKVYRNHGSYSCTITEEEISSIKTLF